MPVAPCDVAVVGAGPAGSFCALRLAQAGLKVHLLEEDPRVGHPTHCTGILGREAFRQYSELPREAILQELRATWIVSPSGESMRTRWFDGQAYVIDRARFDQRLADLAEKAGARLRTGSRVDTLRVRSHGVEVGIQTLRGREILQAQAVIIGSGVSYRLHAQVGLERPAAHLMSAQTEVESRAIQETEVYIGREFAPGSFAWAVPIGRGRVRLGVTAHRKATVYLEKLIRTLQSSGRVDRNGQPIRKRPVPIRPGAVTVAERVLAVGDAAGQVKPTTAGGVYYGLLGADLAAKTLGWAFRTGQFNRAALMAYDRQWKKMLRGEITLGLLARKVLERLNDSQLERLVRLCRHKPINRLIERHADFDWHAKGVLSLLTSPRVLGELF